MIRITPYEEVGPLTLINKCKSYEQIVIHTAEKVKKHNCPTRLKYTDFQLDVQEILQLTIFNRVHGNKVTRH